MKMQPIENTSKPITYRHYDIYLLFVVLLLVLIGTVMVFSSSGVSAREHFEDSYHYLKKQLLFVGVGLMLMAIAQRVPYRLYARLMGPLMLVSLIGLVSALAIGHGGMSDGVYRWIRIGPFSFQPSELAKLCVVIMMAYGLAKKKERIREFAKGFAPLCILAGVYILLILAEKDLGGAVTLGFIVVMMFFVAGTRLRYLAGLILACIPALYYLVFASAFRRKRMLAFMNPWEYRLDSGFQIIQSFVAFKEGGLKGVGLGEGKQKLFYLPEAHTDFIFSVLGEELGLLGVLLVIGLFCFFILRGLIITFKARDTFGMYLAFGLTCLIGLQAFINMSVVMGLLPTKGLTLPFISYGGSSLMVSLMAVGILLNISSDGEEGYE